MTCVEIRRGSIYLSADAYETYFARVGAVAVLADGDDLLILPIRAGGGGMLVKVRNSAGDRVIHAAERLQSLGISFETTATVPAHWDSEASALRARLSA